MHLLVRGVKLDDDFWAHHAGFFHNVTYDVKISCKKFVCALVGAEKLAYKPH